MFFRLLCQLDYQPFCWFVVGGKHLHVLVLIIIYSKLNIHLSSLFFIFSKSFLSMYFCHCFKKAVVCLCVLQKVHATDFFDF